MYARKIKISKWIDIDTLKLKYTDELAASMDAITYDLRTTDELLSIWKYENESQLLDIAVQMTLENIEGNNGNLDVYEFLKIPDDLVLEIIDSENKKLPTIYVKECQGRHFDIKCANYESAKRIINIFISLLTDVVNNTTKVPKSNIKGKIKEMFDSDALIKEDLPKVYKRVNDIKNSELCNECQHQYLQKVI